MTFHYLSILYVGNIYIGSKHRPPNMSIVIYFIGHDPSPIYNFSTNDAITQTYI